MLIFREVSFRYPTSSSFCIEGISLDITPGEFIGIIGRSGIGKSTLLKLALGLLRPTNGDVKYFGINCFEARTKVPFGIMVQEASLLSHLNVIENVALGGLCGTFKLDKRSAWEKAANFLRLAEIDESLWNRFPDELSGGQAQRVALAQSLNGRDKILLGLDEPFGSVDALTRELLYQRLELVIESLCPRPVVLLITHSVSEAVFLCDKIVILAGSPAKIEKIEKIDLPKPRTSVSSKALFEAEEKIKTAIKRSNTEQNDL